MRRLIAVRINACPAVLALLAVSCKGPDPKTPASSSTTDPAPADATGGDTSADKLLESALQTCQAVENSSIPVKCELASFDAVPAVLMEFQDQDSATMYSRPLAARVGLPFCQGANAAQIHAGLVITVGDQHKAFDCAASEWSDWETDHDDDLDQIEQVCQHISDAKDIPVHCETSMPDDVPSFVLTFHSEDAVAQYKEAITDRLVIPFCDVATARHVIAQAIALSGLRGQVYHCNLHAWGQWVSLAAPPKQARVSF